jgi:hypothetical protein
MKKLVYIAAMVIGLMGSGVMAGTFKVDTSIGLMQEMVDYYGSWSDSDRNARGAMIDTQSTATNMGRSVNNLKLLYALHMDDLTGAAKAINYYDHVASYINIVISLPDKDPLHSKFVEAVKKAASENFETAIAYSLYGLPSQNVLVTVGDYEKAIASVYSNIMATGGEKSLGTADTLRKLRNKMNAGPLMQVCTQWARNNNVKTVGVTIPQYKAIIDAENNGVGLKAALEAVGLVYPEYWDAGMAKARKIIADVKDGTIVTPTPADLVTIEMFLGAETLKTFVAEYNNL